MLIKLILKVRFERALISFRNSITIAKRKYMPIEVESKDFILIAIEKVPSKRIKTKSFFKIGTATRLNITVIEAIKATLIITFLIMLLESEKV